MLKVAIWGIVLIILIAACIVGFAFEDKIIEWEGRMIKKIIRWIVRKLKSSERFMNWLDEPSLSEQIKADFSERYIRIINHWRV